MRRPMLVVTLAAGCVFAVIVYVLALTSPDKTQVIPSEYWNASACLVSKKPGEFAQKKCHPIHSWKGIDGEEEEQDKFLLIAAFLHKPDDNYRPTGNATGANADDCKYISRWYRTLLQVGVKRALVFYSGHSPQFVRQLESENVKFIEVSSSNKLLSQHDMRLQFIHQYLKQLPPDSIRYLLITDMHDVFFDRNPFLFMSATSDNYDLYVGAENATIQQKRWMKARFNECYREVLFGPEVLLNVGLLGGKFGTVMAILERMVADQRAIVDYYTTHPLPQSVENMTLLCDMPIFNVAVYNRPTKEVQRTFYGGPFHSPFRKYVPEDSCEYYVYHK